MYMVVVIVGIWFGDRGQGGLCRNDGGLRRGVGCRPRTVIAMFVEEIVKIVYLVIGLSWWLVVVVFVQVVTVLYGICRRP